MRLCGIPYVILIVFEAGRAESWHSFEFESWAHISQKHGEDARQSCPVLQAKQQKRSVISHECCPWVREVPFCERQLQPTGLIWERGFQFIAWASLQWAATVIMKLLITTSQTLLISIKFGYEDPFEECVKNCWLELSNSLTKSQVSSFRLLRLAKIFAFHSSGSSNTGMLGESFGDDGFCNLHPHSVTHWWQLQKQ